MELSETAQVCLRLCVVFTRRYRFHWTHSDQNDPFSENASQAGLFWICCLDGFVFSRLNAHFVDGVTLMSHLQTPPPPWNLVGHDVQTTICNNKAAHTRSLEVVNMIWSTRTTWIDRVRTAQTRIGIQSLKLPWEVVLKLCNCFFAKKNKQKTTCLGVVFSFFSSYLWLIFIYFYFSSGMTMYISVFCWWSSGGSGSYVTD